VVAPPSQGAKGSYRIIQGSLDDLDNLPVIRGLDARFYLKAKTARPPEVVAHGIVKEGSRNDALFRLCMWEARSCDDFDQLLDWARTRNEAFLPPLEHIPFSSNRGFPRICR
jgi:hypothetical protein